jgi:hypothetical protein
MRSQLCSNLNSRASRCCEDSKDVDVGGGRCGIGRVAIACAGSGQRARESAVDGVVCVGGVQRYFTRARPETVCVAIALIVLAPHTTRPHPQACMSRMSVGSNPYTHDSVLSRSPLCLCSSCHAISGHAPARPAVIQSCSLRVQRNKFMQHAHRARRSGGHVASSRLRSRCCTFATATSHAPQRTTLIASTGQALLPLSVDRNSPPLDRSLSSPKST